MKPEGEDGVFLSPTNSDNLNPLGLFSLFACRSAAVMTSKCLHIHM
jgi:hypothetical protein